MAFFCVIPVDCEAIHAQESPHKNVGQGFCKNNFPTFLFNGRN